MYLLSLSLCCKDDQINLDKQILLPIKKLDYVFPKVSSSCKTMILLYSPKCSFTQQVCACSTDTLDRMGSGDEVG